VDKNVGYLLSLGEELVNSGLLLFDGDVKISQKLTEIGNRSCEVYLCPPEKYVDMRSFVFVAFYLGYSRLSKSDIFLTMG
jgi:hypothetical protein